jgi:hypothetical protein
MKTPLKSHQRSPRISPRKSAVEGRRLTADCSLYICSYGLRICYLFAFSVSAKEFVIGGVDFGKTDATTVIDIIFV